jgi:hypothetical protein
MGDLVSAAVVRIVRGADSTVERLKRPGSLNDQPREPPKTFGVPRKNPTSPPPGPPAPTDIHFSDATEPSQTVAGCRLCGPRQSHGQVGISGQSFTGPGVSDGPLPC